MEHALFPFQAEPTQRSKSEIPKKFARTDKPTQAGWGFWVLRSVGSVRLVLLRCYSIFIFMQLCAAASETWSEAEKSMRLSFQSDAFLCDSVQRKRKVCLWPFQGGALPMSYLGTELY
jgi:hypothetical protein